MKINTTVFTSVLLSFCLISGNMTAQNNPIVLNQWKPGFILNENSSVKFKVTNTVSLINTIQVNSSKGTFTKLLITGHNTNYDYGKSEVPVINRLIEIPYNAEIQINIISTDEKIIDLADYGIMNKIIPAQPSISKGVDASTVEFQYDQNFYNIDAFTGYPVATVKYVGTMRGVRIGRLSLCPVSYNPVKNQIKVLEEMVVEVEFINADFAKTSSIKQKFYSPSFDGSYSRLINYQAPNTKDYISKYPVKYVIVSDPMFQSALKPFVEWKSRKGFYVVEAYTNNPSVGSSKTTIKNYLANLYNSGTVSNPAPTYVLFVGDKEQIPVWDGTAVVDSHVTDLYYCEYDGGGDWIADAYYGRFSAKTVAQLQPQIDKTLEWEQYTMPDPLYLKKVVLVAGVDDAMAPVQGNGQINYGTDYYFNTAHTLTTYVYLYGSGSPVTSDDPIAAAQIIGHVSNGVSFANYTAHCDETGWADPHFNTGADLNSLANNHKFAFMMGNCCLSNKFDVDECFGEALLRTANKGAVGYIGATNLTYWDEDYYFAVGAEAISADPVRDSAKVGLYDGVFHESGESEDNWFVTADQMIHAGNLAVTQSGSADERRYWEIYHLMGDPSLMPYIGVPPALTATYQNPIDVTTTSLNVTTEPKAYVAISYNNVLYDAELADDGGVAHLTFTPIPIPTYAVIVATKQFRAPYIGTVQVLDAGPIFAEFKGAPSVIGAENSVSFTDLSSSVAPITSWQWTFTGGTPASSTQQNPVITYNTPGTYNVSLTVSDGTENDNETKTGYITVLDTTTLNALFSANSTVIFTGDSICFSNESYGNPQTWTWSFEGGTPATSNQQNPCINYLTEGTYNVQLTICKDTICDSLLIDDYISVMPEGSIPPQADFYALQTTIQVGNTTQFYDLSYGAPQSWHWIFEGATPSFGFTQNATALYNTLGDYDVTLIVWNPLGYDTLIKHDYIHVVDTNATLAQPIVEFTASQRLIFSGTPIYFTDLSENTPTSWYWTFEVGSGVGDIVYSTDQNPANITYNTPGLFDVKLVASNSHGSDSLTKTQYIVVADTVWPDPRGYCDTITNFIGPISSFYHLQYTTWGYFPGHNSDLMKC
ncbi:MAG: PKD domain-containing protein, partial [Bacteroidia bacterium]|nr:PKD domain-containing protein [Bacteroidia bacterium]